jgi:PPOX class probable F420-dependent enzyme
MAEATVPASHRDLLQAQVGVLSTVGADGFPRSTAVWFLAEDDGSITLSLTNTRQKIRNLRRNPACALLILDTANPYCTLEVRARAELAPDPEYATASRVVAKYGNPFDPRQVDKPGEERLTVTLHPVKVNVWGAAA